MNKEKEQEYFLALAKSVSVIQDCLFEIEVKYNQDIADAYENDEEAITTDGTDDINFGRYECAKGLLNQIEKWSKE